MGAVNTNLLRAAADLMEQRPTLTPADALGIAGFEEREQAYLAAFPDHQPSDREQQIAAMRAVAS